MTRTHLKSRLLNFKETLKRGTRHITSIEIWSSDIHWTCWTWQNRTSIKNIIRCRIELHGTAPICDCRWKLFKTATTAVAPCHRHSVLGSQRRKPRIARPPRPLRKWGVLRLGAQRARPLSPLKWHPSSGYARVNQGKADDFWGSRESWLLDPSKSPVTSKDFYVWIFPHTVQVHTTMSCTLCNCWEEALSCTGWEQWH